ncbi:Cytochrome P450 71AU50 [Euphorbia peplus]|nr:Cytochrome P450 71AU50 [Euphorbia peplus]
MALLFSILALFALLFLVQAWLKNRKTTSKYKLPPGPTGLPIFGSLHLLGKFPHRALHQLAKTYGPIMHLRLGLVSTIVVSSPQAAESFLKTHDIAFASRPPLSAAKYISYEQKNLTFAPYGTYWRNVRKMCTLELLSNFKINSFKCMRKEELNLFIDYIKEAAREGMAVDLSAKVASLNAGMSCRMVFGKKYLDTEIDARGFKAVIQEGMELAATPNLGDYIPQIAPFDLQGLTKQMKALSKVFDAFFEKIIEEHIQFKDDNNRTKDFVDVMLEFMGSEESEYRIGRDHVKAIMLDMLAGSMDTSAAVIEWTLSEIMKNPRVMKKVQKELEEKVGLDRIVEESDLENLKYLDMVIKESFRLHPIAPLLIPHKSTQDTIVDGFFIPKNSNIFINVWAIGRDTNAWSDAEKFLPERFVESKIDYRGRDFELIPFGSGRRGCPGIQLGITVVRLVVAQLLHCFDWKLPNEMLPDDLDMTEKLGLVMPRVIHLQAVPSYRLQI